MSYSLKTSRGVATPYGSRAAARPLSGLFDSIQPIVAAATGRTGGDDPIEVYTNAKKGYLILRKGMPDPRMPSQLIPNTNYAEAYAFGEAFKKYTVDATSPPRSENFIKVWKAFDSVVPGPASAGAFAQMIYPKNVEFWTAAHNLAVSTGGSNMVPSSFRVAAESVWEATKELPQTLRDAASHIPGVDPLGRFFATLVTVVKWSAVAGAGYVLWTYVVSPELAKRRAEKAP